MGNDNRMCWIRNMEELSNQDSNSYYTEYEFASGCSIRGLLNYNNGMILCASLTQVKDQNGLYHYLLKVKTPYRIATANGEANRRGYFFRDGLSGELLSIFSLYFRCRFYLLANFWGELTEKGLKIKTEKEFTYKSCSPKIHLPIFSSESLNFSILGRPLDSIKSLDVKYHQQFILACYHYSRALKEVGVNTEMVFIRLVSAIEALSQSFEIGKKKDLFYGKSFDDIIKVKKLSQNEKEELSKIFETRKAKARFIGFIEKYSKGYCKGGNYKVKHCKITKNQLPEILSSIYNARSDYLHKGEPMYLSLPFPRGKKWDTDPSLGMYIDNRYYSESQKLPYPDFFEGLVRHCLLNFLK